MFALNVCEELRRSAHAVCMVWTQDANLQAQAERCGASYVAGSATDDGALIRAGIERAAALMAVDGDDRINLDVALQARKMRGDLRIVLRQFNRTLAAKIEQNFANSSVVSLAALCAATYAAAALDPSCYYALEYPARSNVLYGFSRRNAGDTGIGGLTVAHVERDRDLRIVSVSGRLADDPEARIEPDDEIVVFGNLSRLARSIGREERARRGRDAFRLGWKSAAAIVGELDPVVRGLLIAAVIVFAFATVIFGRGLHLDALTASYFVIETLTTVGYGDISLRDSAAPLKMVAIVVMLSGFVISNLLVAFVAAAVVRVQSIALAGLRAIHARDHIVVCGAGRVGTRVIDYFCAIGVRPVVVERTPTAALLRLARERRIALLTGDGSDDATLDHCAIEHARSVVALTEDDATNLEIALGARARQRDIPVVLRAADQRFATAIAEQFQIRRSFSATTLGAPAFADLATFAGAKGRCMIAGAPYAVEEIDGAEFLATDSLPLCIVREGETSLVRARTGVTITDRVLVLRRLNRDA